MLRKALMAASVILTISATVLWPVSYWWQSAWFDTLQTRPFIGYWCGYALVDGDLVIHWDSPKPPNITPMGRATIPGTGILNGRPVRLLVAEDNLASPPMTPSDGGAAPSPAVYTFYGNNTTRRLALLGWELEHDRVGRAWRLVAPLPVLAILFAFFPLLLGVQGPLLRCRRRNRGLCVDCAYDLTGNESGVCPECGNPRADH